MRCIRAEKENGERGYRHLLDSDKWTEISISEWNHHWTSRVSLSLSRARMTTLFQVSLFRQCVVYRSRVYTVETHLNLSRWLTERPTTVHHSCVLYSPME